jgi:predicted N-acetyltransferase YhbS
MDLREATAADQPAIDQLLDRAFGPARGRRTAARLRGASAPAFTRVADGGGILGSIAIHPVLLVRADGGDWPLFLLGPLASDPTRRGQGIGLALMAEAVAWLDRSAAPCVLIGDAPYYGRFGFSADATSGWRLPGPFDPRRLLLRAGSPAEFAGLAWLLPDAPVAAAA